VKVFKSAATCASCGDGAESTASAGTHGALVLYESSDGVDRWRHAACAAPSLTPAQTLHPMFRFPEKLLADVAPRHLRRGAWSVNRVWKTIDE
jgi:hypothetical protein